MLGRAGLPALAEAPRDRTVLDPLEAGQDAAGGERIDLADDRAALVERSLELSKHAAAASASG